MEDLNLKICRSAHFDSLKSANEAFRIPQLFAELRFDLSTISVESILKIELPAKLIFTCRQGSLNYQERLLAYNYAMELGVHFIDLDFETDKNLLLDLHSNLKKSKTQLILSQHNYISTPDFEQLKISTQKAFDLGADIAKIITTANTTEDTERIYFLYEHFENLVAFTMGELGAISRAKILTLGAPFTYAAFSTKEQTASGQLTFQQTADLFYKIKNGYL